MIFNGYTPQTLLPFLIAIAVVVAILYLLRVRRRVVSVPYIGLWRDVMEKRSARRWHDWIRRLLSFLLIMCVVGLIALALMDPRQEEDDTARRHAVIIVDSSASMAAASGREDCDTRFACAIQDAQELVSHMTISDRAVIIEAGGIVSAISGPFQSDKAALSKTLSTMQVHSTSMDVAKSLELAANLVKDRANPEIYLLTDGQFDGAEELSKRIPSTAAFEQRNYGSPTGNLSIEAFNARRYIANRLGFEVFFRAHNGFDKPVTARLKIIDLADEEMTLDASKEHHVAVEKTLTMASGDSELRLYDNLTLSSGRMAATLEITDPADLVDPMTLDNIAYARIPDYSKPVIACVTPGNLYLEAALLLNENYRVSFIKPTDPSVLNAEGQIDLSSLSANNDIVILDNSYRNLPHTAQSDWQGRVIFINPDIEDSPFAAKSVESPMIERVNGKHAIARWLSLKNLNIARANVFSGIKNDELIMRAIEGPLMVARKTDKRRMIAVGFSLVESDLIFRVGLPVFFINGIDWLMDENSDPLRGFETGTAWHVSLPDGITRVDVTRPDGSKLEDLPVYDNAVTVYGEYSGFYRIEPKNISNDSRVFEYAANFSNVVESDLSRDAAALQGRIHLKTTLGQAPEVNAEESSLILRVLSHLPASSQYIWVLALLLAMFILAAEWLTYHRRWTV
ncbi:MAG: BatA and WFA domain-containing protein [Proteobacteria bacterium]|nr:BatA and WFA domain-containing protein [Pseudomonadota bacterium]